MTSRGEANLNAEPDGHHDLGVRHHGVSALAGGRSTGVPSRTRTAFQPHYRESLGLWTCAFHVTVR